MAGNAEKILGKVNTLCKKKKGHDDICHYLDIVA